MDASSSTASGPSSDRGEDGRTVARQARYDLAYRAAIELFVERGYENTTMEAIAERAGASRASMFNYFPRKPAILEEWSRRRRDAVHDLLSAQTPADESGLEIALRRYMRAWATVNDDTRVETAACGPMSLRETDLLTDSGISRELTALLDDAARRGELAQDVDTALAGRSLAAAYFALLDGWLLDPSGRQNLRDQLDQLASLFLNGLRDRST